MIQIFLSWKNQNFTKIVYNQRESGFDDSSVSLLPENTPKMNNFPNKEHDSIFDTQYQLTVIDISCAIPTPLVF